MSKYYQKQLKDFQIGDPVIMNDDTSYVTAINENETSITLVLSGICNYTGTKNSTIKTYGTPKRIRRTNEQIQNDKQELINSKNEEMKYEILYKEFIKDNNIIDKIENFEKVKVSTIIVGDIIMRYKNARVEKIIEIEDLGDSMFLKGWKGFFFNSLGRGYYTENKDDYVFKYVK